MVISSDASFNLLNNNNNKHLNSSYKKSDTIEISSTFPSVSCPTNEVYPVVVSPKLNPIESDVSSTSIGVDKTQNSELEISTIYQERLPLLQKHFCQNHSTSPILSFSEQQELQQPNGKKNFINFLYSAVAHQFREPSEMQGESSESLLKEVQQFTINETQRVHDLRRNSRTGSTDMSQIRNIPIKCRSNSYDSKQSSFSNTHPLLKTTVINKQYSTTNYILPSLSSHTMLPTEDVPQHQQYHQLLSVAAEGTDSVKCVPGLPIDDVIEPSYHTHSLTDSIPESSGNYGVTPDFTESLTSITAEDKTTSASLYPYHDTVQQTSMPTGNRHFSQTVTALGTACALPPSVCQTGQRKISARLTQISASDDPFVIDRITAAAINFQNRQDTDDENEETSSVQTDSLSVKDDHDIMIEEKMLHFRKKESNSSDTDISSTTKSPLKSHFKIHETPSIRFDGNKTSPILTAQHKESSISGYTAETKKNVEKDPSSVWKKFSVDLRKTGLLDEASFSNIQRRPGGQQSKRETLLQELVLQQAEKHGKYVQWCPSMILAFISCADSEIVVATKIISSVLALRQLFIYPFEDTPSMCIFPPLQKQPIGEGSNEPIFDPCRVLPLPSCDAEYRMENGVFQIYFTTDPSVSNNLSIPVYNGQQLLTYKHPVPTVTQFLKALKEIMAAAQHPGCKTFTYRRLGYLKNRFSMHLMFNASAELQETKDNKHRDFYNVRKVDTHVHHSACMHQKHLLRFIRKKYRTEPDQVVAKALDGTPVTLQEIFDADVGMTAWDASVDLLNVHALGSCFHRFDIFNSKYNPFGQALLREVFLKTDNMIQGRYLAEITKEVVEDLEDGKYQFVEWRLSIYGKTRDEWKKLAQWIRSHNLSSKQVRWMIQVPRLYHVYRKLNLIKSFAELLQNIFEPLIEAVINPEAHPDIFYFLIQMNGWDSVDDESIVSKYTSEGGALPLPENWTEATNPPYSYWAYYMYANIRSLNALLAARGMRTLPFRPHCGEAGSISHLASMYLLADGINHGIMLRKTPVLQYLYYLHQIGLAVSPLSNNALFHEINKNPFNEFFSVGLNVSLSTDDPLMFHFTDESLLEEYSCCAHVWKLSPVDLCEIARNSVIQSHFEPQLKQHWLGQNYKCRGRRGNNIQQTNVSNVRTQYREDTLVEELRHIRDVLRLQEILDNLVP